MIEITTETLPIKVWASEEDLVGFDNAIEQAANLANHPLAVGHVALMPDFHLGYGMPVGGVFATSGGVVPNAVGVDIGCGMMAQRTYLHASDLDAEKLQLIRERIHEAIPVGNGPHGNQKDNQPLWPGADETESPVMQEIMGTARVQVGTLGGGNHFVEIQRDEEGYVWVMVHSGSRGLGKQVCDYYDDWAKGGDPKLENGRVKIQPKKVAGRPFDRPDDLCFLMEGEPGFESYLADMRWCMRFAEENRHRMMYAAVTALNRVVAGEAVPYDDPIETHHNYANLEEHDGLTAYIHRKGAVHADGLVIIPGSMGTASYIGRGLANPESFETCSHGAGRVLGRKEASRTITHEQAVESMKHVVFGIREGDYDEMPMAYKDIDRVMANQSDLVEVLFRLTPLAVVKG